MSKKCFRPQVEPERKPADYPTLDQAQTNRRDFLSRLGLAILGAGTLGSGLAACDGRPVGDKADAGEPDQWQLAGVRQVPDAGPSQGDSWEIDGEPPMPDAGPPPDAWTIAGGEQAPDTGAPEPDMMELSGAAPMPDSGSN